MTSQPQIDATATTRFRWPQQAVVSIAIGEGCARLCNLVLIAFVSRRFGVLTLGAYALAQGISLYLAHGMDLGLRHIGARLVALHSDKKRAGVVAVQRKRLLLT